MSEKNAGWSWVGGAYPVTIDKVRMSRVDIACFHRYQIADKLVGRLHRFLEEGDNHLVELFLEARVPPKELAAGQFQRPEARGRGRTYLFLQQLRQYPDQLVVDQAGTLQTRILQPLDLLLHDELERGGADEQGG